MATKYWISTSSTSFNTAANWSDGIAPANGDVLVFNGAGTANCSTNLGANLTTVTVIVEPGYTGEIGAVATGAATYLALDGGTLKMPRAASGSRSSGSPRVLVRFDKSDGTGSVAGTVVIEETNSTGTETFYPPVMIRGGSGGITGTVTGNSVVGFAMRPGETTTLTSLRTSAGAGGTPIVFLAPGVTLSAAVFEHGIIYDKRDTTAPTIRVGGATYDYAGTGATTTLIIDAGVCYYSGTGTITAATVKAGTLDFSRDPRGKTVTDCTCEAGYTLNVDNGVPGGIIFTNAIQYPDGLSAGKLITPAYVKGTLVAIA